MTSSEFNPFLYYSQQLQVLLTKASKESNPTLWLYHNDVRTILFMLEALTRLHDKAFDEKLFTKWNKRFKKLEDLFGEIDHYLVLESEFKLNKKISKEALKYFSVNAAILVEKCNQRLLEKDWFNNKLQVFDNKLRQFNVDYNNEYLSELKHSMRIEIDTIINLCSRSNFTFTKIEEEVHELRRKLRWLSIYAQALNGLVQLKKTTKKVKCHLNYFTKEIVNSPYNKLPPLPKSNVVIEFDKDSFLALSWLINELGNLKDVGLKVQKLADAIFIAEDITREQSIVKAIDSLGLHLDTQKKILKKASELLDFFIVKDKVLENLIIE
jgi:hypothetical protein